MIYFDEEYECYLCHWLFPEGDMKWFEGHSYCEECYFSLGEQ